MDKRFLYVKHFKLGNFLVKARCTDSTRDQTGVQYSSKGRTYVTKALTNVSVSRLKKQRSIWPALMCAFATTPLMSKRTIPIPDEGDEGAARDFIHVLNSYVSRIRLR